MSDFPPMVTSWPFPLKTDQFELPFAIRVLRPGQPILIRSDTWDQQLQLKQELLSEPSKYFQASPAAEAIQREAVDYLRLWSPGFALELTGDHPPLLEAGLQIQEDLILLSAEPPFQMMAGAVFFPSGWSVGDKMGQTNQEIHRPVPGYARFLHGKTERLLEGMKYARPVSRDNWGIRPTDRWNQLPEFEEDWRRQAERITASNAGERCFFRGEYQTLSRLKHSGAILFTIHSWQRRVQDLESADRRRLRTVLETCPQETLVYKGIQPFVQPLLNYLLDSESL